ncbi:MAG: putative motility protein [Gallionellaceae bacterium]|nr:putative motility protein [Gallionellaceae bacterium]
MDAITTAPSLSSNLAASQAGVLALRLANESQRQVVDLLAQSVAAAASNPAHLGSRIDTYA